MNRDESWENCPAGVVTALAERLRGRHRLQTLAKTGAGVLLVALLLGGSFVMSGMIAGDRNKAITCSEASSMFAQHHDDQLSPPARRQVEMHLKKCPHCREQYRQMYAHEAHHFQAPAKGQFVALAAMP